MSDRLTAILLLQGDVAITALVKREVRSEAIARLVRTANKENLDYQITAQRQAMVDRMLANCISKCQVRPNIISETIG